MKKALALALCLILLLCGCDKKAVPYYEAPAEGVTLTSLYQYCYADEDGIFAQWVNNTDANIYFTDEFRLEKLSGERWVTVSKKEAPVFNTDYHHFVEPGIESLNHYDLTLYTDGLNDGVTYRISTYYYNDNGEYYQIYATFLCDEEKAEEEITKLMEQSAALAENSEDPAAE